MLRTKIQNKEKMTGTHLYLTDVTVARIIGMSGYDYVWVDLEHSYKPVESVLADIIALKATGTAVLVRVPQDDLTYTKKVLELGVDGIIFPMIRTAEQANKLIASTLYPPYGTRGFGPMNAVDYGFQDAQEYVDNTKTNLCRFIQIEHVDAVKNLDEIMKNEFIDGYIFGANDLSGSINELGNVYGEHNIALIKECTERLHAAGKYVGLSTGEMGYEMLKYWSDMDIDMISAGADYMFLRDGAVQCRKNLQRAHVPAYKE